LLPLTNNTLFSLKRRGNAITVLREMPCHHFVQAILHFISIGFVAPDTQKEGEQESAELWTKRTAIGRQQMNQENCH
jgi:hypothetical protein